VRAGFGWLAHACGAQGQAPYGRSTAVHAGALRRPDALAGIRGARRSLALGIAGRSWAGFRLASSRHGSRAPHVGPVEFRAFRAEVAAADPGASPAVDLGGRMAKNILEQGKGSVDTLLAQLVGRLDGVEGALVLAVGLKSDGSLDLAPLPAAADRGESVVRPYRVAARAFDRRVFQRALAAAGGSVPQAARLLQLPESTFRYRAGKLGLLGGGGRS
jgi:hypothetical protein